MNRKNFITAAAAAGMALFCSVPAFAGTWQLDSTGWWWRNDDGSYPVNCWQWLDGDGNGTAECYYFGETGYLLTGTTTPDLYLVNADGAWIEPDGTVHTKAVGPAGSPVNQSQGQQEQSGNQSQGWYQIGDVWRYRSGNSDITDAWRTINGARYYFDPYGFMVTGFQTIDGDDYYFDSSGALQKKSFLLDGSYYIVDSDGKITDAMSEDDFRDYLWNGGGSGSSSGGGSSSGNGSSSGGGSSSGSSSSSGSGSSSGNGSSSAESVDTGEYAYQVYNLVNEERSKAGRGSLTWNDDLAACAQVRAEELVELFSHTRPDGTSCFTILEENGISHYAAGENIARGQRNPAAVMNSWMNSSGHKANILSSNYSDIGVGCYYQNGTYYWVQIFIHS